MNWKKLSEEKPPVDAYIMFDTGTWIGFAWVDADDISGFDHWCYVERHDGTLYAPERPYSFPTTIENFRLPEEER